MLQQGIRRFAAATVALCTMVVSPFAAAQQADARINPTAKLDGMQAIPAAGQRMDRRGAASNAGGSTDKLDGTLRRLWEQQTAGAQPRQGSRADDTQPGARPFPDPRIDDGNRVQVYVHVNETGQDFMDEMAAAGLTIEVINTKLQRVQGWIAVDQLEQLVGLQFVERITVPSYGFSRSGSVSTEGDSILRANQLRSTGLTGRGIRVGIISDGAADWPASRSSGDLPVRGISIYGSCARRPPDPTSCSAAWTCNEGTAMAEIVHDIAPDADIAVGAASTTLEFIARVDELVNEFKADVVVDDLGFFAEPMFADGDVANAIQAVANRVLFISAAGNSAQNHYEKQYFPGPGTTLHDFGRAEGVRSDLEFDLVVPAESGVLVIMQWNDPPGKSSNDYDVFLGDEFQNQLAGSADPQTGPGSDPLEGFCYFNPGPGDLTAEIVINRYSGLVRRLKLLVRTSGSREYNHPEGSVFGHPALPSVLTVGAISASDRGHDSIALYSSRGPARIDFPFVQIRDKPDLAAIDGVSISGVGGFSSPFYGTSAAAPHVAGIAAQLMSVSRVAQGTAVRKALERGAVDLGAAGFDPAFGHGRVDALDARRTLRLIFNPAPAILLLDD